MDRTFYSKSLDFHSLHFCIHVLIGLCFCLSEFANDAEFNIDGMFAVLIQLLIEEGCMTRPDTVLGNLNSLLNVMKVLLKSKSKYFESYYNKYTVDERNHLLVKSR